MSYQIQLRNDTAANWTSVNPILAVGEIGIETDTGRQKVGNGGTAWNSLAYSYLVPVQTSQSGKFLTTNGTTPSWADAVKPSDYSAKGVILVGTGSGTFVAQTVGTNGQVLTANSAQADGVEWTTINALPSQTGNAGKYLTTNGSTASWASVTTDPTPTAFLLMGA